MVVSLPIRAFRIFASICVAIERPFVQIARMPVNDEEAKKRLTNAHDALGVEDGKTVHADTALKAARKARSMLLIGLEHVTEREEPTRRD